MVGGGGMVVANFSTGWIRQITWEPFGVISLSPGRDILLISYVFLVRYWGLGSRSPDSSNSKSYLNRRCSSGPPDVPRPFVGDSRALAVDSRVFAPDGRGLYGDVRGLYDPRDCGEPRNLPELPKSSPEGHLPLKPVASTSSRWVFSRGNGGGVYLMPIAQAKKYWNFEGRSAASS